MSYNAPAHTTRIAVPPGVGDTYWALCKMEDFKRKRGIRHITLCVKKHELKRALAWPSMVNFVDAAEEFDFNTNKSIRANGFSARKPGVDYVMWPNAVIDTGKHLNEWMPGYRLNLDIEINTARMGLFENRHVVYASSEAVNNNNWFPGRGPAFWTKLIREIAEQTGEKPIVIGAGWDAQFAGAIKTDYVDLISKTSLPEVAGVIKYAKSLTGIISGMTILGNHFRTPTVAIYPDRFLPGFLTSWIKPETPYIPLKASEVGDPRDVARLAVGMSR